MSKPWFAFSKRAAACVAGSAILALLVVVGSDPARAARRVRAPATESKEAAAPSDTDTAAKPVPLPTTLPEREVVLSSRGGQELRVGDSVAYSLPGGDAGAEARWAIDPKQSGLKMGFLFRPGRLFTPLMAGELSLPALPIVDETGAVVARTKPITIAIASNFSEKERASGQPPKAEPALGPLGLPFPVWIQSALAFTLLGFALLGVFFLVRYIRRKAAAALKKILPKKPYDQAALDRFDQLAKAGHLEKGAYKPYYFGISETLKFYFGERFDFDAQESTTSELIAFLRERSGTPGLNDGVIRKIQNLFEELDPVKFADRIPAPDEARSVLRDARELVTSTRKAPVEPILSPSGARAEKGAR